MTEDKLGALALAVCAVMADVQYVQKTGKNSFHGYKYAGEADFLAKIQPSMAAHGLALLPYRVEKVTVEAVPTAKGKAQFRTDVTVTYRLIHKDGGSHDVTSIGSGIDGEDKGAYKAMTGAFKYALRQLFLIPTGDDPEKDEEDEKKDEKPKKESPAQKAERRSEHDDDWENKGGRERFFAAISKWDTEPGHSYDNLKAFLASLSPPQPPPSTIGKDRRQNLAKALDGGPFAEKYSAWLDAHSPAGRVPKDRTGGEK